MPRVGGEKSLGPPPALAHTHRQVHARGRARGPGRGREGCVGGYPGSRAFGLQVFGAGRVTGTSCPAPPAVGPKKSLCLRWEQRRRESAFIMLAVSEPESACGRSAAGARALAPERLCICTLQLCHLLAGTTEGTWMRVTSLI